VFFSAINEHGAKLIGMSELLTTTMPYMQSVIEALDTDELSHVKICIGGTPISQMFADEIGA